MSRPPKTAGVFVVGTFSVQVGVFHSVRECVRYLRGKGCAPDPAGPCFGQARRDYDADGAAWFSIVITAQAENATVVHECVHMADFIMDGLGIPTGVENTEVRAYLTADIFTEVMRILCRKNRIGADI